MTTKDMLYNCDIKLRNVIKSEDIAVETDDWLSFLNQAQELVFRSIIPLDASTLTQFDLSPAARNNLATLIKDKSYTISDDRPYTTSKLSGSSYIFEYPSDLKYVDYAEVILIKNNVQHITRVKDIEPRYYYQNFKNPFKKPFEEMTWRMDYGSNGKRYNEIVIPTGYSLNSFVLRYIIELPCLSLDSDTLLAESLHWDIVDKAVNLCLESHQNNLYLRNIKQNQ